MRKQVRLGDLKPGDKCFTAPGSIVERMVVALSGWVNKVNPATAVALFVAGDNRVGWDHADTTYYIDVPNPKFSDLKPGDKFRWMPESTSQVFTRLNGGKYHNDQYYVFDCLDNPEVIPL